MELTKAYLLPKRPATPLGVHSRLRFASIVIALAAIKLMWVEFELVGSGQSKVE